MLIKPGTIKQQFKHSNDKEWIRQGGFIELFFEIFFVSLTIKKYFYYGKRYLLFLLPIIMLGCLKDADRVNPLDPKSPQYNDTGSLAGQITTYYQPYKSIAGVDVKILSSNQETMTDGEGFYQLNGIKSGQHKIIAYKPGFASDSTSILVKIGKETVQNFKLDALPVITKSAVSSTHISRWFSRPYDLFYMNFQTKVDDPDGASDILSITVINEELGINDTLNYSPSSGLYESSINVSAIDPSNPAVLIGRPVLFIAEDQIGNQCISEPIYLTRIIYESPIITSPAGLQIVGPNPTLNWKTTMPMFPFFHRIEIYRTDLPSSILRWSKDGIASTDTTFTVSDSLEAGKYYWTITIVDKFHNWSRSKEASFKIE